MLPRPRDERGPCVRRAVDDDFSMKSRFVSLGLSLVAFCAAWLGAGCRVKGGEQVHDVRGVIREIRAAEKEVVVRHEEIPGYMQAMTMPFPVESLDVLGGAKAGDLVKFRLHVTATNSHSDGFVVLSNAPATASPAVVLDDTNAVSLYVDVPELKRGDVVPDYVFTNQLGNAFHLRDYRGKVLVISFIFTRCPLPDFCPRASGNLAASMRMLKESPSVPPNWRLLSLSFDPAYDTPRVLESYGKRYGYDPTYWTLGTGSFDDLQPLGTHFGLYFSRNVTPGNLNHNLRTVVLDPQGRVVEILVGKDWKPEQLVMLVEKAFAMGP